MELLPTLDERKWLGHNLRDVIAKQGLMTFVSLKLLEPSPASFPDPWSRRVGDVHRLTQRLMAHAGLAAVPFVLSGFEGASSAWDASTAGWYAGLDDNGRCRFGVALKQLRDPEAAVGVMAHEVAHAWREQHDLVIEDREEEEHLTDLTTIFLGFGILTANNTDRYRTYGNARVTGWSLSSAGYLPPQAMTWLLALQASARGRTREMRKIESFLEPNQRACFEAAMHEIANDPSYIDDLALPPRETWPEPDDYEAGETRQPALDEVEEPDDQGEGPLDPQRNAGKPVYRVHPLSLGWSLLWGLIPGAIVGAFLGAVIFDDATDARIFLPLAICVPISEFLVWLYSLRSKCSDKTCGQRLPRDVAVCPGCGGTISGTLRGYAHVIRLEEDALDRRAAEMGWEECPNCHPEEPCARHA